MPAARGQGGARRSVFGRAAILAAVLALAGCGGDGEPQRAAVVLEGAGGSKTVDAEVADSDAERVQGLRGREALPREAGMLFVFDEPVTSRFVMEDTLIPLSIAFADGAGRIVAIRDMEPCPPDTDCPAYGAGRPYVLALEVNRGAFDRWGIDVGDSMRVASP